MRLSIRSQVVLLTCALPHVVSAQAQARPLGKVTASIAFPGRATSIVELANGDVLLVGADRRLLLADSALRVKRLVVDSLPQYLRPVNPAILLPSAGDSIFYVDGTQPFIRTISATGEPKPQIRLPRGSDLAAIQSAMGGRPGVDAQGRIVYAVRSRLRERYDSLTLVAANIHSRTVDTLGSILFERATDPAGGLRPIRRTDAWVVGPSGVCVFRSADFGREEWPLQGERIRSGPLPYEAIPLSLVRRATIVDSVSEVQNRPLPPGAVMRPGETVISKVVDAEQLPDTRPPFMMNGVVGSRADSTTWVILDRENPATVPRIADVIDGMGKRIDRVEIPPGWQLIAVGKNAVYLLKPGMTLQRVAIR